MTCSWLVFLLTRVKLSTGLLLRVREARHSDHSKYPFAREGSEAL